WVEECGYHCAGQSVPNHVCDAMEEPRHPATAHAAHAPPAMSPHEAMGHGGHAAMSMDSMVRDMRNRFLVAAIISVPILLWSAIGALLNLAPPKAVVLREGEQVEVSTSDVRVGDLLLVRPGSKVPVDAEVEEGTSEVEESVVTGESLPVSKAPGSALVGGSINKNGTLRARAARVGSDTALAQIVKLVQEAQNSKAPGQQLADRAAFWLVLVALVGGTLTLVAWLLTGSSFSTAML